MRGGGLNRVALQRAKQNNLKKAGELLQKQNTESLLELLQAFSTNLENFAEKYQKEIQFSPDFREKFYSLCMEIGVDPLASVSTWNKKLNLTEFYYNLAIQIITISMTKGPLIELNALRNILISNTKKSDITLVDIEKAIDSVSDLKCGFQIVKIKDSKAVVTVPMEKSTLIDDIIEMASENGGWIGYSICYNKKNIQRLEFEDAINRLLSHGVAWEDEQNFINKETKNDDVIYWFPGLLKNNN